VKTFKTVLITIVAIVLILSGYFLRTSLEKSCVPTEIIVRDTVPFTVKDTIEVPKPYEVEVPGDSVIVEYVQDVDTAKILYDYLTKKSYKLDFSNDSIGKIIVDVKIHKNSITESSADLAIKRIRIHTIETKTVEVVRPIQFYGTIGSSVDFKFQQIGVGVDLGQKYMIGVSGVRFENNLGLMINTGIKF